jgi:hypothetical protein
MRAILLVLLVMASLAVLLLLSERAEFAMSLRVGDYAGFDVSTTELAFGTTAWRAMQRAS